MTIASSDLEALITKGEEIGCIAESDIAALSEALNLDEDELNELHAAIEARGLEVNDDCARQVALDAAVQLTNLQLATYTTDALQQFLNEAGRHKLLTPDEELEYAKRIEMGDLDAKDRLTTHNLR